MMKRLSSFAITLALLSVPAFASKNSQTVTVPSAMKVGSAQLAPGDYDVTWTGTGPDVQVTMTRNKKVVATLQAKLVQESTYNGVETDSQGGVDTLHAIHMKNMTLIVEDSSASAK
jgi:hypothetical protein